MKVYAKQLYCDDVTIYYDDIKLSFKLIVIGLLFFKTLLFFL